MRKTFILSTIALLAPLLLAAPSLAADPPGSTPSGPTPRDPGTPSGPNSPNPGPSTVPLPGLPPGPTHIGIERHVPPPQPPDDLTAAQDAEIDAMIGVIVIFPDAPGVGATLNADGQFSWSTGSAHDHGGPQSLAGFGPGWDELLETDCSWTNDNVAKCEVFDCDDDGVCTHYGEYCQNEYGEVIPCP